MTAGDLVDFKTKKLVFKIGLWEGYCRWMHQRAEVPGRCAVLIVSRFCQPSVRQRSRRIVLYHLVRLHDNQQKHKRRADNRPLSSASETWLHTSGSCSMSAAVPIECADAPIAIPRGTRLSLPTPIASRTAVPTDAP